MQQPARDDDDDDDDVVSGERDEESDAAADVDDTAAAAAEFERALLADEHYDEDAYQREAGALVRDVYARECEREHDDDSSEAERVPATTADDDDDFDAVLYCCAVDTFLDGRRAAPGAPPMLNAYRRRLELTCDGSEDDDDDDKDERVWRRVARFERRHAAAVCEFERRASDFMRAASRAFAGGDVVRWTLLSNDDAAAAAAAAAAGSLWLECEHHGDDAAAAAAVGGACAPRRTPLPPPACASERDVLPVLWYVHNLRLALKSAMYAVSLAAAAAPSSSPAASHAASVFAAADEAVCLLCCGGDGALRDAPRLREHYARNMRALRSAVGMR